MFNIMNLNNIENIFYWTDNNGAVSLPGIGPNRTFLGS